VEWQLVIGAVVALALLAAGHGVQSLRRRWRRQARKWYHDHVRLTSSTYAAVRFERPAEPNLRLPTIQLAVRDLGLRTCRLEENPTR
jgi:transposase-like protein